MSDQGPRETADSPPEEPPLLGVVVHFLGFVTSVVGPALVYLAASDPFVRENARQALNWYLTFHALVAAVAALAVVWERALFLAGAVLAAGSLVSVLFLLMATLTALGGGAWEYPLAPEVVGERE